MATEIKVHLRKPHPKQREFLDSTAKRRIIRAGRRGGKTVGVAQFGVEMFLKNERVLYGAPTSDQVQTFWFEVCESLREPIDAGIFIKNETNKTIELPHTKQRIRAKTAWNADTMRGDYAGVLILDEFQLMAEDAWEVVCLPMLLDTDGYALIVYTPPSLRTSSRTKARNPRYAADMFKKYSKDTTGRWECFHFTSMENPHINKTALAEIQEDMTALAYKQEIMAEDVDEAPGALWKWDTIEALRVDVAPPLSQTMVGLDPSATSTGDECGIIVAGRDEHNHYYVLEDVTLQGAPMQWAQAAIAAYYRHNANSIVYETNQGGEMVRQTLQTAGDAHCIPVFASRGKYTRAEPISLLTEQGRIHHVGKFPKLESELCLWEPGGPSPNRLDAFVWVITKLKEGARSGAAVVY